MKAVSVFVLAFVLGSVPAQASIIFVFSQSDAGFGGIPVLEDWESFAPKDSGLGAFSSNGINYLAVNPPGNMVVTSPGYNNFGIPGATITSILAANGNENFTLSPTFTARRIGFDIYTINEPNNQFSVPGAQNVEVTVQSSSESALLSLASPPGNFGFLGIVSTDPILSVYWLADLGGVRNTGIDNIRVSDSVPEPGSVLLLAFAAAGILLRRHGPRRAEG
jgi:hypothetical protein